MGRRRDPRRRRPVVRVAHAGAMHGRHGDDPGGRHSTAARRRGMNDLAALARREYWQNPKDAPRALGVTRRARVRGKFLFVGTEKRYVRGVTYGACAPDAGGNEYHDLATVERDFAQMAANGINAVRIPHTMPPRALLDIAARHGLRVMVGLSAEQYIGYLIDRRGAPDTVALIRDKVRRCAGHPALLCYALGNELP